MHFMYEGLWSWKDRWGWTRKLHNYSNNTTVPQTLRHMDWPPESPGFSQKSKSIEQQMDLKKKKRKKNSLHVGMWILLTRFY